MSKLTFQEKIEMALKESLSKKLSDEETEGTGEVKKEIQESASPMEILEETNK